MMRRRTRWGRDLAAGARRCLLAALLAASAGAPLGASTVAWLGQGEAPSGQVPAGGARNPGGRAPAAARAPAAPTNLTASALGSSTIQLAWTLHSTNETAVRIEMAPLGGGFSEIGTRPPHTAATVVVQGLLPATGYLFRVRVSNAAGDSGYSNQAAAATLGVVGPCVPDPQTLCLGGGRFRVAVAWQTATGSGSASVAPASSPDSGLLWFFSPDNWELLLKVLNGCAIDGSYWVFLAATSNVGYEVSVTDSTSGKAKVYYHPLDSPAVSLADTGALAVCP
jgi:hypothetical protein